MNTFKKTWNGLVPTKPDGSPGDPLYTRIALDFAAGLAQQDFDFQQEIASNEIQFLQSVYIDNKDNANIFQLLERTTNQRVTVKAATQGWYSILCGDPPSFSATSTVAGTNATNLFFVNVPMANVQWATA